MPRFLLISLAGFAVAVGVVAGIPGSGSAQTYGSQVCTSTGYPGAYTTTQATCQVTASAQLGPPETIFVVQSAYNGAAPSACQGVISPGYSTQGTVTSAPANLMGYNGMGYNTGQAACEFTVTSGLAPAGSIVGTEIINVPYGAAGGAVQLTSFLCGDPSCATGGSSAFSPPAPPAVVTIANSNPCALGGSYAPNGCVGASQSNQSDPDDRPRDDGHGQHGHGHGEGGDDGH
ncbi:MAG TPA: hypothetical protein VK821_02055 [Dehalococcoidia bacterium]|nr:hypothetical protein [Dehalococcoidia bacterium]